MKILKALNALIDMVVIAALVLAGTYALYALWDNHRIYAAAENVQAELLRLKPDAAQDSAASFARLLKINPDVCAWVTLEGTHIDYPVMQGRDNLGYLNTDAYGNFALAGSIFLDARCDRGFHDRFSLLYGHHMEGGRMFGDLERYEDGEFFAAHSAGTLYLPDGAHELEIFACLRLGASEEMIFAPQQAERAALLDFASQHSLHLRPEVIDRLRDDAAPPILGLSTCSSAFTDARTVVLAAIL